jgi:uncharacterized protein (DUF433 family)
MSKPYTGRCRGHSGKALVCLRKIKELLKWRRPDLTKVRQTINDTLALYRPNRVRKPFTIETLSEAIQALTVAQEGCWLWKGPRDRLGRPTIKDRRSIKVHDRLVIYCLFEIQKKKKACPHDLGHSCGNVGCVNPGHIIRDTIRNDNYVPRKPHKVRGEACRFAKLTTDQVRKIVQLHNQNGWMMKDLAKHYGLHQTNISAILHGRSWSHVTGIGVRKNSN